jgi:hypothetical protein
MRRIRPAVEPMLDALSRVPLANPIYEAILVGVTDDKPSGYFEEIPNADGFFQVLTGVDGTSEDDDLLTAVVAALRAAVEACPFSTPDKNALTEVITMRL